MRWLCSRKESLPFAALELNQSLLLFHAIAIGLYLLFALQTLLGNLSASPQSGKAEANLPIVCSVLSIFFLWLTRSTPSPGWCAGFPQPQEPISPFAPSSCPI